MMTLLFLLMALTYPLSIGVRHVIDNYVSSLLQEFLDVL